MRKSLIIIALFALIQGVVAQNYSQVLGIPKQNDTAFQSVSSKYDGVDLSSNSNIDHFYFDASGGYFPRQDNASWAGYIAGGYRMNEQSAFGIGLGTWGRIQNYRRSVTGIGFQYRHNFPKWLVTKFELGYAFVHTMHDDLMNKEMTYVSEKSKPYYATIEAHWRLWRFLTLGVAMSQTTDLYFKHHIDETNKPIALWRINAFTVQLGVAFNGKEK